MPTDALARLVELAQGPAVMVEFRDIEREQATEQALRRTTSSIDALARQPEGRTIAEAIRTQLAALPAEQAEYKGLSAERETVLRRLEGMLG